MGLIVTGKDTKDSIIQDFIEIMAQIGISTQDEIDNKLAKITKRVRKLYTAGRDIDL